MTFLRVRGGNNTDSFVGYARTIISNICQFCSKYAQSDGTALRFERSVV